MADDSGSDWDSMSEAAQAPGPLRPTQEPSRPTPRSSHTNGHLNRGVITKEHPNFLALGAPFLRLLVLQNRLHPAKSFEIPNTIPRSTLGRCVGRVQRGSKVLNVLSFCHKYSSSKASLKSAKPGMRPQRSDGRPNPRRNEAYKPSLPSENASRRCAD